MKKLLLLFCLFTLVGVISSYSQGPTPPKGYLIKKLGDYVPNSGGNGSEPKCNPNDESICILVRASTTSAYWNPLYITDATLEIPSVSPGTLTPISSITSTHLGGGVYSITWTTGAVWTGPFGMLPSEYTVTEIP